MIDCKKYAGLVYKIIGAAMNVHRTLGCGLMEAVYQEALHWELTDKGIPNEREKDVDIYYKNHHLDKKYRMDMVVGNIIIELKSVSAILPEHRAQVCNYLRLTRIPLALLINFGESELKGERWAYDLPDNTCYLVDKNMDPVLMDNIAFDFSDN